VKALRPAVYIYSQRIDAYDKEEFHSLMKYGGNTTQVDNLKRESYAYLTYIIEHYRELPGHVLFSPSRINLEWEVYVRMQVQADSHLNFP